MMRRNPPRSMNPLKEAFICVYSERHGDDSTRLGSPNSRTWAVASIGNAYIPRPDESLDERYLNYSDGGMRFVRSFPEDRGIAHVLTIASELPTETSLVTAALFHRGALQALVMNSGEYGTACMIRPFVGVSRERVALFDHPTRRAILDRTPAEMLQHAQGPADAPYRGFMGKVGGRSGLTMPYPESNEFIGNLFTLHPKGLGRGFDVERQDAIGACEFKWKALDGADIAVACMSGAWSTRDALVYHANIGVDFNHSYEGRSMYERHLMCPVPPEAITRALLTGPFGALASQLVDYTG